MYTLYGTVGGLRNLDLERTHQLKPCTYNFHSAPACRVHHALRHARVGARSRRGLALLPLKLSDPPPPHRCRLSRLLERRARALQLVSHTGELIGEGGVRATEG